MEKSSCPKEDHADPNQNKDIDNAPHTQEPPASSQKCCSGSEIQSKKRKHQSSNHNISAVAKDISKMARMMMEKDKQDDVGACIDKLEKLGWGTQDQRYNTALLLFGESADYRKLWFHLKPESCGNWV